MTSDDNGAALAPSCSTCPWMRWEGNTMRCYHEPPTPMFVGTLPSKIAGMPPMMVTLGMSPEVHPDRFCRHHPLLAEGVTPRMPRMPAQKGSEARN